MSKMETKCEHFERKTSGQDNRAEERGNALIYVLIAIVLFAALSFTMSRQTDTSEAGTMSEDRAELYASQLISYTSQAKSVVDQMLFTGAEINDLDFTLPGEAGFNTAPTIYKVYHPDGGGLNPGNIPEAMQASTGSALSPGWYMGRFNNVDWTPSAADDVILTAFQIDAVVCATINEKINGSRDIPQLTSLLSEVLVDETLHAQTNVDLTTGPSNICADPACENASSLCVLNSVGDAYAFFTVIADQ